jgi:integron integrase
LYWVKRFLCFHGLKPPHEIGPEGIKEYLSYLAMEKQVSPSTQNQAMNAIVFLYKQVLEVESGNFSGFANAKVPLRKPTVLNNDEIRRIFAQLKGQYFVMAGLMYGSGLRLMECLNLKVKDIDFEKGTITVRFGKGGKDRATVLSESLTVPLREQLDRAKGLFNADKEHDASMEWFDYHIFPSNALHIDNGTRKIKRGHISRINLYREIKRASVEAGIEKTVSPHTFRHSFATHLLESGCHIQTIQELLGHADEATTMIYMHPMNMPGIHPRSPLDNLNDIE